MQLPPPAVFHDKYQWEIWKNTAGKSATPTPIPPHTIFLLRILTGMVVLSTAYAPPKKLIKLVIFNLEKKGCTAPDRTLQIPKVLRFLWKKSQKIATLPQIVPYNSDMWQKPALFATIACLQQDLLSQIISNYDVPVKNVHLRGVRYPIITSVSHRVSLKKLLCSAISLEIMVALNIWKAIDKCSQCQVMHQTARNIIF